MYIKKKEKKHPPIFWCTPNENRIAPRKLFFPISASSSTQGINIAHIEGTYTLIHIQNIRVSPLQHFFSVFAFRKCICIHTKSMGPFLSPIFFFLPEQEGDWFISVIATVDSAQGSRRVEIGGAGGRRIHNWCFIVRLSLGIFFFFVLFYACPI